MKLTDYDIKVSVATCMDKAIRLSELEQLPIESAKDLQGKTEEVLKVYLTLVNKYLSKLEKMNNE